MTYISNPPSVPASYAKALKPAVVRWCVPGWFWEVGNNTVVVLGRIYFEPIFVDTQTTFDRIGINVTGGDGLGGLADLRIFNEALGLPTSLILSAGTVSTNAPGAQEIVINQTLPRGYYFLAVRVDQAPTIRGIAAAGVGGKGTLVSGIALTNALTGFDLLIPSVDAAYADPAPAPTAVETCISAFVRLREA